MVRLEEATSEVSPLDILAWLSDLNLEQYAEIFRENDIDAKVLLNLTSEDLKEIGVLSVGHRRKLLGAITALRLEAGHSGSVTATGKPAQTAKEREAPRKRSARRGTPPANGPLRRYSRLDAAIPPARPGRSWRRFADLPGDLCRNRGAL